MGNHSRRKVNITEVARAAGVSKMTVSRMLNHAGKVAPATRVRVQQVIDELEYHPSPIAQGLVTNRTRIIGLMIFDEIESVFFHQILLGIQHVVGNCGYNLLIFSRAEGTGTFNDRYFSLVDGILCMGTFMDNDIIEKLDHDGIPYVVIGKRNWRKVDPWFCTTDYVRGFFNATRYLLNMGHRNIAMIGGIRNYEPDMDKYTGFQKALFEAGIPYNPEMTVYEDETGGLRGLLEKFRPTAVVVEGMTMLLALLVCTRELGISIPGELSVIGGSTTEIDVHTLHSLTGIHELTMAEVPRRELGITGTELLLRLIQGERDIPKAQWLTVKFTEGESCRARGQG